MTSRKLFSSTDPDHKFGTRILQDQSRVFEHNAWDHAEWNPEQEKVAKKIVEGQVKEREKRGPRDENEPELQEPSLPWDAFYSRNENKFFKDRHWLSVEFPELTSLRNARRRVRETPTSPSSDVAETDLDVRHWPLRFQREFERQKRVRVTSESDGVDGELAVGGSEDVYDPVFRVLECGCGTGSTIFPLLDEWAQADEPLPGEENGNDELSDSVLNPPPTIFVNGCDFAETAVELVKGNPAYSTASCNAFVYDLTSDDPMALEPNSIDVITCIFVLSALDPVKWERAASNIARVLRPGGILLFRDYARYDLTQLRFKGNRLLKESLYTRGDGTMVYFFDEAELSTLFPPSVFTIEKSGVDRRLIVNRGRQVKMYRCWLQAKIRKL
ncbi:methyltransferase [Gonapodya prolifera JEL478]|uniref:tRNA N(3)-methylcytidine methyltransferase n=1 Tax=Gonapodya prolifera (strain JEL478) TaxID=1344416 RepID=A0A139AV47_GONPJ|nr:methyltransferase [Gonapodya prolifera JEL478]|eukprot:KXS20574.1 methyltransferase [Gonapodya prolifera JEL478]